MVDSDTSVQYNKKWKYLI